MNLHFEDPFAPAVPTLPMLCISLQSAPETLNIVYKYYIFRYCMFISLSIF